MPRGKISKQRWLIFVDTNILLDFYRVAGESADRQIRALEQHQDSLICSDQVRMEFLKHRQKIIVENIRQLEKPKNITVPQIVTNYAPSKMLSKHIRNATESYLRVQKKIEDILQNPSQHDHVYQSLNRIFDCTSPFNLKRENKERFEVRRLARKRFSLGYPPRKPGDTSLGDAVNWEWIIKCALKSDKNHNVLIVSRDGDYGVTHSKETYLNDWLRREFKERISQKRNIELTNRLTVALKRLEIRVTEEDEKEETKIVESQPVWQNYLAGQIGKIDANIHANNQATQNMLAKLLTEGFEKEKQSPDIT